MFAADRDDAEDVRPVRIPLSVNDPNAGRSLTRSVDRVLRDRRTAAPVLVELHGSHLPAPLVAALIANLRRLREAGIVLAAVGTSPALRNALAVHGLDRVLAPSPAARSGRRRAAAAEIAWPAFALMLLLATVACVMVLLQQGPGYGGI